MDQHNREVSEMEEILEQQLSEVEQDHRLKVWDRVEGCGWDSDLWRGRWRGVGRVLMYEGYG